MQSVRLPALASSSTTRRTPLGYTAMLRTVHRYSDTYEEDKLTGYQLARVVKHGTVDVREASRRPHVV